MSMLVNPFIYGSVAPTFHFYATWNGSGTDISDSGGYQALGTFTVPAAWNGRKVRTSATAVSTGGAFTIVSNKNGGSYDGRASSSFVAVTSTNEAGSAHSAPIEVATGNTLTVTNGGTTGDGTANGVEVLPSGVKGALVNRISTGFSVGTGATVVQWNNEVYDTDGYHDNSTNPSRLTIPSGTSGLVRIQANVSLAATQSQIGLGIKKNGSLVWQHESTDETLNVFSPPMTCVAGDYFEVEVYCSVATTVQVNGASWMALEELDSSLQYAIASHGNSSTLPTGAVWTQMTGTTESVDVGNWHASNKFTVPSGVSRVRVGFFGGSNTGLANAVEQAIFLNGSDFTQAPHSNQNSSGDEFRHAASTIINVSPGDEFTFWLRTGAGSQTGYGTYWIEEVPAVTS